MRKTSNKLRVLTIKRVCQISESHCGPAVLEMLLSYLGKRRTQKTITKYCRVKSSIHGKGARVDQLSRAVKRMYPNLTLWYKKNSRITDVKKLINIFRYPVGVEWQGLFEFEEESGDDDLGHFVVVIGFDKKEKRIVFADPYKHYCKRNRILNVNNFVRRWWDINEVKSKNGNKRKVKDKKLLFIVLPSEEQFPKELGMKKFE